MSVEAEVVDGFGDVVGGDSVHGGQVGDRAVDVEHLVVGSGGYAQLGRGSPHTGTKWDMSKIAQVLATACTAEAEKRYRSADPTFEAVKSCRDLSYNPLFANLEPMTRSAPLSRRSEFMPIILAAISAMPWVLGALVALAPIKRFL